VIPKIFRAPDRKVASNLNRLTSRSGAKVSWKGFNIDGGPRVGIGQQKANQAHQACRRLRPDQVC
jgi:hypothetical protein